MIIDPNFQTPVPVCEYMVRMIPAKAKTVLEPTPGLNNLVCEILNHKDVQVFAPGDFFIMDKKRFDCVVMNPPFTSKSAFMENAPKDAETKGMKVGYYILKECMEMSDNVIALMPWYTIADSDVRMRHLKGWGLKSLTVLPRKTFEYARVQTCVLELKKGYLGETIFKTFEF